MFVVCLSVVLYVTVIILLIINCFLFTILLVFNVFAVYMLMHRCDSMFHSRNIQPVFLWAGEQPVGNISNII